jgi:hypothetical protein
MDPALGLRGSGTGRMLGPKERVVSAAVVIPELSAGNPVAKGEEQRSADRRCGQAEGEAVSPRRGRSWTRVGGGRFPQAAPAVRAPAHAHALLVGQVQHARAPGHAQRARVCALQADALRLQPGGEAGLQGWLQGDARLLRREGGEAGQGGDSREGRLRPGAGARRDAYLEAAGSRRARREVAQGVPLQLHLHVAGHPGRFPRAEAPDHGQLQPQRVGETHSLASVRAAAAGCPRPATTRGRRAGPAPPTRNVSPRAGAWPGPALPGLLLRLLLEAGPLAAVVRPLGQCRYKAQVAGYIRARWPLVGHVTPEPQRG